ncbi:MAG: glycoside hydrolase family 2 TIM barrel-domain containing protein [Tepidisphaeraceae bacterium]
MATHVRAAGWALIGGLLMASTAIAQATITRLTGSPGQWQLERDGKPYFIHGAGGGGSMELLKNLGGNSVRTWGADDLGPQLDAAQKLGLSVCVGIWLGHEDRINHFNYDDPAQVARQLETAKAAILKYKDHPAVLMWGIGNEMEGSPGTKASIWRRQRHRRVRQAGRPEPPDDDGHR